MSYDPITPVTSVPADNDDSNSQELSGYDVAHCHVYATAGTGTAALMIKDPAGRWVQFGPSWSVAADQAGREVARINVPRDRHRYKLLVTGGPTLGTCFLVGMNYGR